MSALLRCRCPLGAVAGRQNEKLWGDVGVDPPSGDPIHGEARDAVQGRECLGVELVTRDGVVLSRADAAAKCA